MDLCFNVLPGTESPGPQLQPLETNLAELLAVTSGYVSEISKQVLYSDKDQAVDTLPVLCQ